MSTKIVERNDACITIEVKFSLNGSMLEMEEQIQDGVNEAGALATEKALERFDTDGSPIQVGSVRMSSKGKHGEKYETPYGQVRVERHVYQTSRGGRTYCPLEAGARMMLNSTPKFSRLLSFKYACFGSRTVQRDLSENHSRRIASSYVRNVADLVGTIAQAKEETWNYDLPTLEREVGSISLGLDGTCMLLREEGWREAMVGTISLYDRDGERLHTIYAGCTPEYGKSRFREHFRREIERVRAKHPEVIYMGLADGAADNWDFLKPYVKRQVVDFYHATKYVTDAADALFGGSGGEREDWLRDRLHRLKHKRGAAKRLLEEMKLCVDGVKEGLRLEKLVKAITYFENHYRQMSYARQVGENLPIGSGVTEAGCKVLIKQRLCASGMRWRDAGASAVLTVRALVLTPERWAQFWQRIGQSGVPTLN